MSSQNPQSDSNSIEDLKMKVQDHKKQINLPGLVNTNLPPDITGLQKTVTGLQRSVSTLQHTVTDLERSTRARQKAIEANPLARLPNCFITSPVSPRLRLRDPLNSHIAGFPANIDAIRGMKLEDVGTLLAAFDMPIDDVVVHDERLLAVYIGVKVELLGEGSRDDGGDE